MISDCDSFEFKADGKRIICNEPVVVDSMKNASKSWVLAHEHDDKYGNTAGDPRIAFCENEFCSCTKLVSESSKHVTLENIE